MITRLFLCCLLAASSCFAQDHAKANPPDYDRIKKQIRKKNDPAYYPVLMAKYKANDTSLSEQDVRMLYYGSFFESETENYSLSKSAIRDSIKSIVVANQLTDDGRKKLMGFYEMLHEQQPFDIKTLIALFNLYDQAGSPKAKLYDFKLSKIVNVIFATGDGKSTASGFHVRDVSDEYGILSVLGLESEGQSLIGTCDYLKLKKNKYDLEGLYFDVSQIFKGYKEMFK
jgi:hypothetical protein